MKVAKFGPAIDEFMDLCGISPHTALSIKSFANLVLTVHILSCLWWLWKVICVLGRGLCL